MARWIILGSMALRCAVSTVSALDPAQPPGGNFDLRQWKLTLPDADATEIAATQLTNGYTQADYFYTAADGAMNFWCPVTGGLTQDTSYPRCELREQIVPDNNDVNWSGYGTNILNAQCKVTQVPSSQTVVIGQIHSYTGKAYPLVKLELSSDGIKALVKKSPNSDKDTTYDFGSNVLGSLITYQISLANGLLSLTVNASNQAVNVFQTDPAWASQLFYFKAGDYVQDHSGSTNEGANVMFYSLSAAHVLPIRPTSLSIASLTANSNRRFSFTLQGSGSGIYFIQTSTDLKNWDYVLVTNSVSGLINFTDAPAGSIRFYRGGAL
jgi:hypothetical protein